MDLPIVDVLVPTAGSPASLGATLASLASQRYPAFLVTMAQPPAPENAEAPELDGLIRVLEARGHAVRLVDTSASPFADGPAQALLDRAAAEYVLVVDKDVFLEADLMGRLVAGLRASGSAFVGSSVIDLTFRDEHLPEEEAIEFWDGPVRPEAIDVGSRGWARRRVHRGANLQHLRERLPRTRDRLYHVADIAGCVLYETARLRSVGGFRPTWEEGQWRSIPPLSASATQRRLIERYGGAGLFPSGAYRLTPITTEPLPSLAVVRPVGQGAVAASAGDDRGPNGSPAVSPRAGQPPGHLRHLRRSRPDSGRRVGAPGIRRPRGNGNVE